MEIISKLDASELDLMWFFTGKSCKKGHVAERSVKTGSCRDCTRAHNKRRIDADPEDNKRRARAWVLANPERNREQKLRNNRRRKYGLEYRAAELLAEDQKGLCPGCLKPLAHAGTPHLDHDHSTGKIRGLLCLHCNPALGRVMDSPETLRRLADYLEYHRSKA